MAWAKHGCVTQQRRSVLLSHDEPLAANSLHVCGHSSSLVCPLINRGSKKPAPGEEPFTAEEIVPRGHNKT